jgi:hypothetical protein
LCQHKEELEQRQQQQQQAPRRGDAGDAGQGSDAGSGSGAGDPQGGADDAGDAGHGSDAGPGSGAGEPQGGAGKGAGSGWSASLMDPDVTQSALEAILSGAVELPSGEFGDALAQVLIKAGVMKDPTSDISGFEQSCVLDGFSQASKDWSELVAETGPVLEALDQPVRDLAKTIEKGLGTKLRDLLQARVDESSTAHRRGRRLINARVARVRTGVFDVFRRNEETDELSTAVHILCDMSGSMFHPHSAAVCAGAACFAVATILDKFQVPFAWTNFGSGALSVKSFKARWRVRRNHSCIKSLGGTHLTTPMLKVMPELSAREERRKLCLIITDGEPDDVAETISLLDTMQMLETEVAVLFIGDDGQSFELGLAECGIKVARAAMPEDLAAGVFSAIENAF